MAVDLTSTSPKALGSIMAYTSFTTPAAITALTYGSGWVFDDSTIITLCSDVDGSKAFECTAQFFKVSPIIPPKFTMMTLSNARSYPISLILIILANLLADYKFEEGSGTSLANSGIGLGSAQISTRLYFFAISNGFYLATTSSTPPVWSTVI